MQLLHANKNLFYLKSTFDERLIPKDAGFRWDSKSKYWWTKDIKKAEQLIKFADEATYRLLMQSDEDYQEKLAASQAVSSDINIPVPPGLTYMPFQKAGIEYALQRKDVLLADEMGLGKTIQAIGIINASPEIKKVLIICPASLKINWYRELNKWLIWKCKLIDIVDAKHKRLSLADIHIINYDILKKFEDQFVNITYDLLIADEVHYCKSHKAQRSKAFYNIAEKAKMKAYLTGTPIINRPSELYHIVNSLGFGMSWYEFMTKFTGAKKRKIKGKSHWNTSGSLNLHELQTNLREKIMIRRLKEDVLTDLPAKLRQIIELPATGIIAEQIEKEKTWLKSYHDFKKQYATQKDKAINKEDYKKIVEKFKEFNVISFSEIAHIRHETAVAKIPAVIAHLKDALEAENKVVFFAHHRDVLNAVHEEFFKISVLFTGQTSFTNRQQAVDLFQNNQNTKLFCGSIQAAGVGITLTASSTVIFGELDWTPSSISQAEDRCHRIGQKDSVLVQHLLVDGSIDVRIAKIIIAKQEIIHNALDSNRQKYSFNNLMEDMKK